jgi:DNA-directed RNA polymerase subunit RPC12/RpoP
MATNRNARKYVCPDCAHKTETSAQRGVTCDHCGRGLQAKHRVNTPQARKPLTGQVSTGQVAWQTRMKQQFRADGRDWTA